MDKRKLYAEISKTEAQDDGTIKVWGYASSQTVDSQGEIITADAMKAALPDYMKFANVREMHQPKAAGVCIEASVQEDGRTFFGAHVVDKEAVQKVQLKVYKGFSIGGRVTKRDEKVATVITGIQLSEVSLVDRPANPDAVFTVYKLKDDIADEALAVDELSKVIGSTIKASDLLKLATDAIAAKVAKTDPVDPPVIPPVDPVDPAKPPITDPPKDALDANKGMYSVAILAGILSDLNDLRQMTEYEASYEGDGSKVPAELKTMVDALANVLTAMVAEETAELTSDSAKAVVIAELAKFTGADRTIRITLEEAIKKAGAKDDENFAEFVTKLAAVAATATALTKEVGDLKVENEKLGKMAAQPKGALRAIGKGEDLGTEVPEVDDKPIFKADGVTLDREAMAKRAMVATHKRGIRLD